MKSVRIQSAAPKVDPHLAEIAERLSNSEQFWALIRGIAALELTCTSMAFVEASLRREDFNCELGELISHASECIREEEAESRRFLRTGADRDA